MKRRQKLLIDEQWGLGGRPLPSARGLSFDYAFFYLACFWISLRRYS